MDLTLTLRVWSNEALCSLIDRILLLGGVCDIIRNHPVASWLWWRGFVCMCVHLVVEL